MEMYEFSQADVLFFLELCQIDLKFSPFFVCVFFGKIFYFIYNGPRTL